VRWPTAKARSSWNFCTVRHGEMRWIESRTLISYNEAGKPVRRIGAQIGVTERKQAEQALAERNTHLELAHKAARVGSYTYDVSAGMMRFSRPGNVTYGLSERALEISAQQWSARVHRDVSSDFAPSTFVRSKNGGLNSSASFALSGLAERSGG